MRAVCEATRVSVNRNRELRADIEPALRGESGEANGGQNGGRTRCHARQRRRRVVGIAGDTGGA
jgi:hypothetical protein